jgi:SlyX protein
MSDTDRLTDIEMTLAHQEKVIADLSDVINAQWKEIESLKRQITKANTKIEELEQNTGQADQANVKPPHW